MGERVVMAGRIYNDGENL